MYTNIDDFLKKKVEWNNNIENKNKLSNELLLKWSGGYLDAAEILINSRDMNNTGNSDNLIFPFFFLTMHGLELFFKSIIKFTQISNKKLKFFGHDIYKIWSDHAKKMSSDYLNKMNIEHNFNYPKFRHSECIDNFIDKYKNILKLDGNKYPLDVNDNLTSFLENPNQFYIKELKNDFFEMKKEVSYLITALEFMKDPKSFIDDWSI